MTCLRRASRCPFVQPIHSSLALKLNTGSPRPIRPISLPLKSSTTRNLSLRPYPEEVGILQCMLAYLKSNSSFDSGKTSIRRGEIFSGSTSLPEAMKDRSSCSFLNNPSLDRSRRCCTAISWRRRTLSFERSRGGRIAPFRKRNPCLRRERMIRSRSAVVLIASPPACRKSAGGLPR